MTFRAVEWLYALAALPALLGLFLYAARARAKAGDRFATAASRMRLVVGASPTMRAVRAGLVLLGITATCVALSGPSWGSQTRTLRRRGVDVVVVLDLSKSMLARDVRPSRIDRAKAELHKLFEQLAGDRVGLVAFAGDTLEFPMTTDYPALELFLRDVGPYDMPIGGTAIGRALVAAGRLLERSRAAEPPSRDGRPRAAQVVVLITDGEDHEGDPVEAARELAQKGVVVHVLGVGSSRGETIPTYAPDGTQTGYLRDESGQLVTSALTSENEQQLRAIADAAGGTYVRAAEGTASLASIRRALRTVQATERRIRRVSVRDDRYALPLWLAFSLLVLEGVLADVALRRRPVRNAEVRS